MSGVPHRMCRMPQKISLVCLFFFHALRFEKMGGSAFFFEGFALGLPRTLSWFSFVLVHKRMGGSASPILSAHHHSASGVRSSAIGNIRLSLIANGRWPMDRQSSFANLSFPKYLSQYLTPQIPQTRPKRPSFTNLHQSRNKSLQIRISSHHKYRKINLQPRISRPLIKRSSHNFRV